MATVSRLARKLLQCGGQTGARSVAGSQITRLGLQFDGLEQGGHGGGSDIGACAIDIVRKARSSVGCGPVFHGLGELRHMPNGIVDQ